MTAVLHSAELFLLAWSIFTAAGSVFAALVARVFGGYVSRWEPRARHRTLVLLAALPILSAAALMLSATLPSLLSLELPRFDHCTLHNDGHPHLCFVHLPATGVNALLLLPLLVLLGSLSFYALRAAASVTRALRLLDALVRSGHQLRDLGVVLIETAQPLCLAGGLLRPSVLISRGLFESLTIDERAIVLAHEQAHVRRRDALVTGLVRLLAALHFPSVRAWLVREVGIAAEQVCDEEAGQLIGDRVAVASAILAVERAARGTRAEPLLPIAAAFGEGAAVRRVEALLAEPGPPRSLAKLGLAATIAALATLGAAGGLHHLIESLISFVAY